MPKYRAQPLTVPTDAATLGYLAGLFDGEGQVTIRATRSKKSVNWSHGLSIRIDNTDERAILWLKQTVGGFIGVHRQKNPKHKTCFYWTANSHVLLPLLRALLPLVIIKRAQVELALEFLQLSGPQYGPAMNPQLVDQRAAMKGRLKLVNQRGVR